MRHVVGAEMAAAETQTGTVARETTVVTWSLVATAVAVAVAPAAEFQAVKYLSSWVGE